MDTNCRASSLSHRVHPRRRRRWQARFIAGPLFLHTDWCFLVTDCLVKFSHQHYLVISNNWLHQQHMVWPIFDGSISPAAWKRKKSFYFQSHEITHCCLSAYDYWTKFVILVKPWVMDNYRGVYRFGIFIIKYSNNQTKLWQQTSWHHASVLQGGWVSYFSELFCPLSWVKGA